jgi:hypothetical protein
MHSMSHRRAAFAVREKGEERMMIIHSMSTGTAPPGCGGVHSKGDRELKSSHGDDTRYWVQLVQWHTQYRGYESHRVWPQGSHCKSGVL